MHSTIINLFFSPIPKSFPKVINLCDSEGPAANSVCKDYPSAGSQQQDEMDEQVKEYFIMLQ